VGQRLGKRQSQFAASGGLTRTLIHTGRKSRALFSEVGRVAETDGLGAQTTFVTEPTSKISISSEFDVTRGRLELLVNSWLQVGKS
jgi:hypothetical protein